MNDETARDMTIIAQSIGATAAGWRGNGEIRFPGEPMDRKQNWGVFAGDHLSQFFRYFRNFMPMCRGKENWQSTWGAAIAGLFPICCKEDGRW